jgi:predicted secreted protein
MMSKQKRLRKMTQIIKKAIASQKETDRLMKIYNKHEENLNCDYTTCADCKLGDKTVCDKLGDLECEMEG